VVYGPGRKRFSADQVTRAGELTTPSFGIVLQAAAAASNSTSSEVTSSGEGLLVTAVEVVVVLALIAVFGMVFRRVTRRVALKAGASKSVAHAADQWIAVIVVVLAVAAFASITGISSAYTTLTVSGIAGLAATLALQTTLSNIISGILMLRDGVLRLGDDIEYGSVRGEVVKLSLRTTWIKRQDGAIAMIGNSNLASGPIVNHTATERLEKKLQV
jgi:small-conductance mechanosensitive channel